MSMGVPEDLNTKAIENTHSVQLDTAVQCCLTTKGEKDAIRTLALQNMSKILGRHWQK